MPGGTLVHEVANRIANFGAIINPVGTGGLGFVVLERYPVRPSGDPDNPFPGETPEAFSDTGKMRKMKRTIAVIGQPEVSDPGRQAHDLRRWNRYPLIYIFAEPHQTGKQACVSAHLLIEQYLAEWQVVIIGNQRVGFEPDGIIQDPDDSPDFPEMVVQISRFRAVGTRRIVPIA